MAEAASHPHIGHHSPFVVEPTGPHTHTLILLHGLGSNGQTFGQELLETGVTSQGKNLAEILPGARFIFPTAKRRRSSAFGRAKLTLWFDLASLDDPELRRHTQLDGLADSAQEIFGLIEVESASVPFENIVLGGISHGCAMGLCCLMGLDQPIGGFVGMSGWLPFRADLEQALSGDDGIGDDANPFGPEDADQQVEVEQEPFVKASSFYRDLLCLDHLEKIPRRASSVTTPVFLGHGADDEKVTPDLGEGARDTLVTVGYEVSWHEYADQGHWYKIPDEIDDIVNFLRVKAEWKMNDSEKES